MQLSGRGHNMSEEEARSISELMKRNARRENIKKARELAYKFLIPKSKAEKLAKSVEEGRSKPQSSANERRSEVREKKAIARKGRDDGNTKKVKEKPIREKKKRTVPNYKIGPDKGKEEDTTEDESSWSGSSTSTSSKPQAKEEFDKDLEDMSVAEILAASAQREMEDDDDYDYGEAFRTAQVASLMEQLVPTPATMMEGGLRELPKPEERSETNTETQKIQEASTTEKSATPKAEEKTEETAQQFNQPPQPAADEDDEDDWLVISTGNLRFKGDPTDDVVHLEPDEM
jgi:hypothetical protein